MRIIFIFVVLLLVSCLQPHILKASCESALLLHGTNDSHFQAGHLIFMKTPERIEISCLGCSKKWIMLKSQSKNKKYCSMKCYQTHVKGRYLREKSVSWKGNNVKYNWLHQWLRDTYGAASKCERCGRSDAKAKYEWASINHAYTRNIEDWMQVCVNCHSIIDGKAKPIYKLTLIGEIIGEYESIGTAAYVLNLRGDKITKAVSEKIIYGDSYWQHVEKYQKESYKRDNRILVRVDAVGNVVSIHNSPNHAGYELGIKANSISACVSDNKRHHGFHWKYKNIV